MPSGKGWKEGAAMNAIQKYFKYRQSLIDQYAKGDMTKREYLQKNYEAVVYGDIGPFRNMDTVERRYSITSITTRWRRKTRPSAQQEIWTMS